MQCLVDQRVSSHLPVRRAYTAGMRALLLVGVMLLVACGDKASDAVRAKVRADLRAEREAKVQAFVAQPPKVLRHDLDGGQLMVLDIPVSRDGSKERQTCFVWRDEALKSASFTCPTREVYIGQ